MVDYLNSDAVRQASGHECVKCIHFPVCSRRMGGMDLERCEDFKDAADVVEVRHGEWVEQIRETIIPVEYDSNGDLILHKVVEYTCSLCDRLCGKKEPYCHCGAKMDGGKK